ncbi:MAG TPA: glycosyltransferase family 4 protein [Chloroflexia bacterium]|nr:glycosyltransferase family 4 protein [Chloroflexia bacterium]
MTATLVPLEETTSGSSDTALTGRNYLHVNPRYFPYIGGSEYYMQQLAERLAAAESASNVAVYTTNAWDLEHFWSNGKRTIETEREILNGVHIRRFPVQRFPLVSPLFYPGMRRLLSIISETPVPDMLALPLLNQLCRTTPLVPALTRSLRKDGMRYDLVHAANAPLDSMIRAAFEYSRRVDAAFVLTPFVHLGEPTNKDVRRFYTMRHQLEWMKQANAVFTMTSLERDFLAEKGVPESKMHIIGVGVVPEEISGGDGPGFRQKHAIEGPLVFFQGTAAYDKGAHHTVQAMQKLWQQGFEATLVIAGPVMTHFQRYYDELPPEIKKNIRFLGFISPQEKRDLFAAGDLFVMPSRTDSFGIVYLEAWLCGKPVIGARAGGVPAVISDEVDGLLVNFGAVDDLAAKIKLLLEDRALADRMGQSGYEKVLANYTWPVVFGHVQRIYRQILD